MTAFRFSKRAGKYVWLSLPGLFSLALTGAWLVSIAPSAQLQARQETQWRNEVAEQKARADYLEENRIYTDYDKLIFQGVSADQEDLAAVLYTWSQSPESQAFNHGKAVRLLDQFHQCMGFYISGEGVYLAKENPGLCEASNADVDSVIKDAKHI
jgi:hypothetical protein